ncbi:hypothetical protein [Hymenobacter mucosus]|uniref:ChrR-like cupin domain-containing protein n=1 Tax=Hymenobacter mucosus TaxID=1411120 RepID=A0A239A915_9BACT|nr:hypothetical protein [Hymenobacter mucosus]SNR92107.1 hypothetical protein SAMN06269173_11176 [Hymenobacter mucosus]
MKRTATYYAPLLGNLWPVRPFKVEQFGPLTKYTLGEMPDGRWAMLHRLTEADAGSPHDHPCDMESHGIHGSYCEQVFCPGPMFKLWGPGSSHHIGADCIHRITKLYNEEVWTLVFAGPVVRQWKHYPELG